MGRPRKQRVWSDESVIAAARIADSKSDLIRILGVELTHANRSLLKHDLIRLKLNTNFPRARSARSARSARRLHVSRFLHENSTTSSGRVRAQLIRDGVKDARCEWCGIDEWRGLPAPLELDHINGVGNDHRLENLRILCRNCHAQTDTFAGKNTAKQRAKRGLS